MSNNIIRSTSVHNHMTRSRSNSLVVPRVKGLGSKSFLVSTIKDWNKLPVDVCNSNSVTSFKFKVKKFLRDNMLQDHHTEFLYY